MPVVLANQVPELPAEAKAWLMLAILVILLVGGVLIAALLGRVLGPRGPWARSIAPRRPKADDEQRVDAWRESARRMGGDAADELADVDFDDDDEPGDDDRDDEPWRSNG